MTKSLKSIISILLITSGAFGRLGEKISVDDVSELHCTDTNGFGGLTCSTDSLYCCSHPESRELGCENFVWGKGCYANCNIDYTNGLLRTCGFYRSHGPLPSPPFPVPVPIPFPPADVGEIHCTDANGIGGLKCNKDSSYCCSHPDFHEAGCEDFVWGKGCYAECSIDYDDQVIESCEFHKTAPPVKSAMKSEAVGEIHCLDANGLGGLKCNEDSSYCCSHPGFHDLGCEDFVWGKGCFANCKIDYAKLTIKSCEFHKSAPPVKTEKIQQAVGEIHCTDVNGIGGLTCNEDNSYCCSHPDFHEYGCGDFVWGKGCHANCRINNGKITSCEFHKNIPLTPIPPIPVPLPLPPSDAGEIHCTDASGVGGLKCIEDNSYCCSHPDFHELGCEDFAWGKGCQANCKIDYPKLTIKSCEFHKTAPPV